MFYIRPQDQGQIIEVAYSYTGSDVVYKRVTDRSEPLGSPDRVQWYRGELDWSREPEGTDQSRAPCVHEWEACNEPQPEAV